MNRSRFRVTSVTLTMLFFCGRWLTATGYTVDETRPPSNDSEQGMSPGPLCETHCSEEVCVAVTYLKGIVKCIVKVSGNNSIANCTSWCHGIDNAICCYEDECVCCSKDHVYYDADQCSLSLRFMVAAQIALGAALLLAVSALSFLVWKMCCRNSLASVPGRSRVRVFCGLPELPRRSSATGSINSVQTFVIRKMRDRPPRYEDCPPQMPPCYDEIVLSENTASPPLQPHNTIILSPHYTMAPYGQVYPYTATCTLPHNNVGTNEEIPLHTTSLAKLNSTLTDEIEPQSQESVGTRERQRVLLDEAVGGVDNPAFIPDLQERHI